MDCYTVNVSFFQELLTTIAERGRSLLDGTAADAADGALKELAGALQSGRGEATGVALAGKILSVYRRAEDAEKIEFFRFLLNEFKPDQEKISVAAQAYLTEASPQTLLELETAVSSPRQEFFRRLNLAPGATAGIVAMRADLIDLLREAPDLAPVDADLKHLLSSWFNRGFLVLRHIDWSTSASTLEKIIEYEAVHEIKGWEDLRRRLDPADRRCFGFFHPSLVDEPLIFVEVALTRDIPQTIQELLSAETEPEKNPVTPTTAVFYSISNCQKGLQGISFGNFLIKQVAEDLAKEIPSLKTFVTLSPAPRFAAWLMRLRSAYEDTEDTKTLGLLEDASWAAHAENHEKLESVLLPLAAEYFLEAKTSRGKPVDPVARFHLGNGARLERINWLGDKSAKGLRQSHGLMVNYLYELKDIETNHEAYINHGAIAASKSVRSMLKSSERVKKQNNKKRKYPDMPDNATAAADG